MCGELMKTAFVTMNNIYSQPDESQYVVVEFYEEKQGNSYPVSIISSDWIFESNGILNCYWPAYFRRDKQREEAVKEHHDIDKEMSLKCAIRVKYSTDDYEEAEEKLAELEVASSSASGAECNSQDITSKREVKKKRDCDFQSGYSSEDMANEIPCAPKLKNKLEIHEARKTNQDSGSIFSAIKSTTPHRSFRDQSKIVNFSRGSTTWQHTPDNKLIIERLQTNEGILRDILRRVQRVEQNIVNLTARTQNDDVRDVVEIETLNELSKLDEFENKLNDITFFSTVSNGLGILGGRNAEETCRNILGKLFSRNLSLKLNWTGRHEKVAFSKYTNTNKLILVVVRKNTGSSCTNASQMEIEKVTKIWLRNDYDRGGGRKHRNRVESE